jgi:hypothetical protein
METVMAGGCPSVARRARRAQSAGAKLAAATVALADFDPVAVARAVLVWRHDPEGVDA